MANSEAASPIEMLNSGTFEFIDFGCSAGGSINRARQVFAADRGLGIDISEENVKKKPSGRI